MWQKCGTRMTGVGHKRGRSVAQSFIFSKETGSASWRRKYLSIGLEAQEGANSMAAVTWKCFSRRWQHGRPRGSRRWQQGLGSVAVDSGSRTKHVAVVLWSNPGF